MELFDEGLHSGVNLALNVEKVIYREKTDLQDLVIFENSQFGRVMSLDGAVQTTEKDEFIYHEMFVHVPLLAHGKVRRVLIIGGGDGGAARQLMKHRNIAVTLVDIDRTVIDSTDPHGPGEVLYTEEFYGDCKSCLSEGGIVITQNGVPFVQESELRESYDRLGGLFKDVTFYLAAIPSYVGGVMAYGWATDEADHRKTGLAKLAQRYIDAEIGTEYYTPEIHQAAFALPLHIQKMLTREL